MSSIHRSQKFLAAIVVALSLLTAVLWLKPTSAVIFRSDPVTAAWQRVQDAGSYHFTSDVVQITIPTAKVTNVGRPSRTEQLYLEGQSDLDAAALEFQLWTDGGSVHTPESSLSVRAADGKSYIRQGTGDWQESSSFSDVIAPAGDFMAYLAAARDIVTHAPETRAGITFTRYSFQIDGPTFAVFTRDQMEAAMRARGELPNGVHFEISSYYHNMTGEGELWVRDNGLPVRQLLNIRFPEQNDESVQAQIKVDFSQFGQTQFMGGEFVQVGTTPAAGSFAGLLKTLERQAPAFGALLALLPLLALAGLVIYYRRARTLQIAISVAVIASMVVGPLLSTLKLATFFDTQTARAAEQRAMQDENAMMRELRAQDSAPQFNPHQNLLEVASAAPALSSSMAASAAPSLQPAAVLLVEDPSLDTDQDGLNDFVEQRIGTSTVLTDTDGDLISDKVEVNGFTTSNGAKWYPNPLDVDSNGDSIPDTLEYDIDGNNQPDDSDADGVPDIFDNDNDGDDIPDNLDLAPFVKSVATFTNSNPLLLQVKNLTVESSTAVTMFVDFQLRPSTPEQLKIAENLLDWPKDNAGQIQDISDQPDDLKLLPMLEIRIPNGASMLPTVEALKPYGISVADDDTAGGKIAYVPLNLVTDPQSGERVAFNGRMMYLPQSAWQQPHSIRMVWVVQIDNDYACSPNDPGYDTNRGYCVNQPQIVHRYYDGWTLTGLNVVEEHGADMAIVYEDPTVKSEKDGAMWLLTGVLGERFLVASDVGSGNFERKLTMANLAAKLDRTQNNGVQLYGLPNNFNVVNAHYSTFDEAIYKVGSEATKGLLNTVFTQPNEKPLLLYAYETNIRTIGLDAARLDNSINSYASFSGSQLIMNFDPPGNQPSTSIETTAGFKWSPYCGGPSMWEVCNQEEYWEELEARHEEQYFDPETLELVPVTSIEAGVAEGEMIATQLYALAMLQGFTAAVMKDGQLITGVYASEDDAQLTNQVAKGLLVAGAVAKWEANRRLVKGLTSLNQAGGGQYPYKQFVERLRLKRIDARGTFSTLKQLSKFPRAGAFGAMGLVLIGTAVATGFALAGYEEAELPAQVGIGAIQSAAMVGVPIRTVFVASQETGVSKMQILRGSSSKIGYTQKAGAIGAGIAIGVTWGVFIASATANNMVPFGVAFNSALASTIASTILIILLTIIAFNPIGLIIVGIIAVLDILLTLLCEYGGADSLRTEYTGGCFTISGAVTATIVKALYNYDLMLDTQRADLVTTGGPDIDLVNPDLGYVGGNTISVTFPITTHAVHKDPDPKAGIYVNFYLWFFSKANLRSSTFKYSLTLGEDEITGLERDQMTNQWKNVAEDHKYVATSMYGGKATTIPDAVVVALPPQAGLNQQVEFYQNMGYAVPAYECWLVPIPVLASPATPICYTRTFKGKSSTLIDSLRLDVFPPTLSEFIETVQKEDGGFGLKWDPAFRSLKDEDGDGLLGFLYNGPDPDDRNWDTDLDGLSDSFELAQRQNGVNMSPIQADTDNDGLTDAQELHFNTNPGLADSDNDGLKDGEEVWHEIIDLNTGDSTGVYTGGVDVRINGIVPLTIHVSSDPNLLDSDNDGVSDSAEFKLAKDNRVDADGKLIRLDDNNVPYNPLVVNKPPIRIYLTSDAAASRYVKPGQQFIYTTTVVATAPLDPGVLDISVLDSNGAASNLLGMTNQRYGLLFSTSPTITQQTNFTANGNGAVSVNNTVRTQLEGSGLGAWTWQPTNGGSWSFTGQHNQPRFTVAAPTTLDRPDQYLMTTKAMPPYIDYGSQGDIKTQHIPSGHTEAVDVDTGSLGLTYLYAPSTPDIACNEDGVCMVVWDRIDNCSTATINSIEVLKEGTDGGSGIEPVIYLVRDFSDTDPTDGGYELLWNAKPTANGGNDMIKGETRGPNAYNFPITFNFCDNARIVVYESDDQDNLHNYSLTAWDKQGLAGSNYVQPGGFWNETGDTVGLLYNDSTCDGCEIRLSITSVSKQIRKVAGTLVDRFGNAVQDSLGNPVPPFDLSSYAGNPFTVEFYRPTVATDGSEFLVAWERAILPLGAFRSSGNTNVADAIITRRFGRFGNPLGNNTLVTNSEATTTFNVANNYDLVSRPRAKLVMNWVGDRYLLTRLLSPYQVNATGEWNTGITIRGLDGNGQLIGGSYAQLIGSARNGIDDSYDWAYDPIEKRGLLFYTDNTTNYPMQGQLFATTGGYATTLPADSVFTTGGDAGSPQVEYDPTTNGWLVGWTGSNTSRFEARGADVTTRLGTQTFPNQPTVNSNSLACPAFQSLPVVDLRLEEVPGTTTFADRSGSGSNASCNGSQCPLPGALGAPGAQLSAYALEFDGGDDLITMPKPSQLDGSFSLAFWYKANQSGSGPAFYVTSNPTSTNNNPGFGLFIYNDSGVIEWWAGTTHSSVNSTVNDGKWHFVVATYMKSNLALKLYLDGVLAQSATAAQAPTPASTIAVGGGSTSVLLDQFQLYGVALSADTVSNLKTPGAVQPFCIATSANASAQAIQWNKLSIDREETYTPITASAASIVTVDSDNPTASVTGVQYVKVGENGAMLTIGGTAHDPTSGVGSVYVSVDGISGNNYILAEGKESWVYQFFVSQGAYIVRAKARDAVGNEGPASPDTTIIADATPPQVTIDTIANPVKPVLNSDGNWQVTLSGTAMDPLIGGLPGSGVYPSSVEVRVISTDGATADDQWQTATYNENTNTWTVDYAFPAARLDVTGVYTVNVRAEDRAGSNGGNSTGDAGATALLQLNQIGPSASLSTIDASRQVITEPVTLTGPVTSPMSGIAQVEVAFTPVELIANLQPDLTVDEIQTALDIADPNRWLPAILTTPGATATTWSLVTPATLEGEYQIDLRSTDVLNNVLVTSNAWRGIIDLVAPRVSIVRTESGWGNTSNTGVRFEHVKYNCIATDRYLVAGAFACPGVTLSSQAKRVFNTDLENLFPDRTILEVMEYTTYRFEASSPSESIKACDLFGKCSTASAGQTVAVAQTAGAARAAVASAPQAVVIFPIEGRYVASNGNLPVTLVAETAASLQQVTLELDGNVVETLNFAQSESITRTQRTVTIPNVAEGAHTVEVIATDWDNTPLTTFDPVNFTLDTADPTITLDTDLLLLADTWALGSDILRFNGTASDSVGLAAVQIKIGDSPFVEAGFDETSGKWSTAQLVPDPEGMTLKVIVRAIDKAGRVAETSGNIGVNLTSVETITPVDTIITPTVVVPEVNSVSVSFAGVDGTNEVSAFECRLDDGLFQPCVSPQTYDGLNNGLVHFEVRAIDVQGFVDPQPASEEWTIDVTTLKTTITESPSDPTASRDALFAFSGSQGVTGFECALDHAAYTACNDGSQSYTGLGDGPHTFHVRGVDGATSGAATYFKWTVVNAAPIAHDQIVTTFRDADVDITLTASDSDPLTYQLVDIPTHGFVQFIAPNMVQYVPDSGFAGLDSFTFLATDGQSLSAPATVTVLVNYEPVIAVGPATQLVQYSDGIAPVTLSVTDLDSPGASLSITSTTWTTDTVNVYSGLPPQLSLSAGSNNTDTIPGLATWVLSGTVDLPIGIYTVTVVADDGIGGSITGDPVEIVIEVVSEDVMMRFHGGNPRAVQVAADNDHSGTFDLRVDVRELYPDRGISVLAGDIARANVSMQLVPIGPGGPADPIGCTTEIHDVDYDARLTLICSFGEVPINTYAVGVTVDGAYYGGFDEDVVTIYDPSQGYTTGGATFIWPGSEDADSEGDTTSVGFTIEYNNKGKNVKGQLILIRRLEDGSIHRIKSSALTGLAVGEKDDFTWASFSGKATYERPNGEIEGNHTFVAYVEDDEKSSDGALTADRFWVELRDKDGLVVLKLSMDKPTLNNAVTIDEAMGNISVPGGGTAKSSRTSGDGTTSDSSMLVDHPDVNEPAVEDSLGEDGSTDVEEDTPAASEDETSQADENSADENSADKSDGPSAVYLPAITGGSGSTTTDNASPSVMPDSTEANSDGKAKIYLPIAGSGN